MTLRGKALGLGEEGVEFLQEGVEKIAVTTHQSSGRQTWCGVGTDPRDPLPRTSEAQRVLREVPQDRPEGAQPLDPENHVVVAQGESVKVDVERLPLDV